MRGSVGATPHIFLPSLHLLPLISLPPPQPPPLRSSLLSSSLPASQERRSHAADLLCAIWLTSCHPYPRREWLCRVYHGRTPPPPPPPLLPPPPPPTGPRTPEQKGWEKHTARKTEREKKDKEYSRERKKGWWIEEEKGKLEKRASIKKKTKTFKTD